MQIKELKSIFEVSLSQILDDREAQLISKYYFQDKWVRDNEERLSATDVNICYQDLERLKNFEPLQYVTRKSHFYGHQMFVNKDVLIPRPETEEVVYTCLQLINNHPSIQAILDLGTGSGCIINTIGAETSRSLKLCGIDISKNALEVAKHNAKVMGVDVNFKVGDILDLATNITSTPADLIVSNPPYISSDEAKLMNSNVLNYEPHLALFSEPDPLLFYKRISNWAIDNYPKAFVVCEINEHFGEATQNVFKDSGYNEVKIIKDLQSKDRIIVAKYEDI